MKATKNIARLAVTAGLTAVLSFGGVMTPVSMAFAEGTNGSVTITNAEGNETEFKGYRIFDADVAADGTASNITWTNGDVKQAVEDVIRTEEASYAGTTAQDAADWITKNVTGTNKTTRVASGSIAYKIADAVDGLTVSATTSGRTASGLTRGYWLFVTDASTIGDGEAGTSPIFTVVGDSPLTIEEKTGIPAVEKKIVSDKNGKEYDAADSQIGQDVTYNLYGTIAENYDKYDSYFYQFSDQISKGLTLQKNSAKVYLYSSVDEAKEDPTHHDGKIITDNFTQSEESVDDATSAKTTTWTCTNLKAIDGVTNKSCIVVSYTAKINSDAVVGKDNNGLGNPNTVTLYYSNNPMTTDHGQTVPDTVRDYTYGLKIHKVDLGTEKTLDGARFTIQATGVDDAASDSLYVQNDGSLGEKPWEFETTNGVIKVTGLDAGIYTVTETSAPDGYTTVDYFTFEIKPTMEADDPGAGLTNLTHVLNTNNQEGKVIAGLTDENAGDNKLTTKPNSEIDDEGYYNITVGNTKQIGLPLTGLNGVTLTWIAGGAVLCIGVAHLIRSRKRDESSEE